MQLTVPKMGLTFPRVNDRLATIGKNGEPDQGRFLAIPPTRRGGLCESKLLLVIALFGAVSILMLFGWTGRGSTGSHEHKPWGGYLPG